MSTVFTSLYMVATQCPHHAQPYRESPSYLLTPHVPLSQVAADA